MAQPQQQNFQQTDDYYDPTVGYENTPTGTGPAPSADAVDNPPEDSEGNSPADAAGYPPASSTGYVPGESGAELPETTAAPDGAQPLETGETSTEPGEAGTEIPPEEGALNSDEQADLEEHPGDADGASVAGTGLTPPLEEPPAEGGVVEIPEVSPEAKEGTETRRNSKSQNHSTKYGGRSSSRRRRQSGSGDYYKSTYNSQSTSTKPTKPPAHPYGYQQQQPYQSPCQIGVIPMRSAAFQAPRIPLPKLCKNLLPDEVYEGQEDEDGVAFQFKPQTHCRTEVTFTIEPKPQPPWLTMLNCGFKPMVNCSAPPCYLSPSGNPGMDYMGGTQTVVNRTFGSQVQYCGMANFPTLQQIQNSFPGGKIIDASRKDKKPVSDSGSNSGSSSEYSSSSESESEEEYHHQHYHPYHHGLHQAHYHQAPAHHPHPQHPHHQNAHHVQHHQNAQAQKNQQQKPAAQPPRRRSTNQKSHQQSVSSEDSRLPKKSTFTARRTLRASNVHDHHDHKHRHSHNRHSHSHHHHHVAESFDSAQPAGSDLSRSSDWHL